MSYTFSDSQTKKIRAAFGHDFFGELACKLEKYCARWRLRGLELVEYYSVNCIFFCRSPLYGDCVLKICGNSPDETAAEYRALTEYAGRSFCRALDADLTEGVLLLERIFPGCLLSGERSLESRLASFSSLIAGLHIPPADASLYPSYAAKIGSLAEKAAHITGDARLLAFMRSAADVCADLTSRFDRKMLLHGDLHYDNILLGAKGQYKIIDPHGFVGDPVLDISRYLLNEYWDGEPQAGAEVRLRRMLLIIDTLGRALGVPAHAMKQGFFIDMALTKCWDIEGGDAPNHSELDFAERLLDTR